MVALMRCVRCQVYHNTQPVRLAGTGWAGGDGSSPAISNQPAAVAREETALTPTRTRTQIAY